MVKSRIWVEDTVSETDFLESVQVLGSAVIGKSIYAVTVIVSSQGCFPCVGEL